MTSKAVVYTINQTNIELVATSLFSLIKHYDNEEALSILLLADGIFEKDITILRAFSQANKKEQIEISVWQMPQELQQLTILGLEGGPAREDMAKFFVPKYFSNFEKIIYLAAETLFLGDVTGYFGDFTTEFAVGAVKDFKNTENSQVNSDWFLSDSLIFNTREYNNHYSVENLIAAINNYSADSSENEISNQLFKENVHFLPAKYNVVDSNEALSTEKDKQTCVVKNFRGDVEKNKPWHHLTVLNNWDKEFWINFTEMKSLVFRIQNNTEAF